MMAKNDTNISQFRQQQKAFCQVRNLDDLAFRLFVDRQSLDFFSEKPQYDEFEIPKKSGGFRHIEDPEDPLKALLRSLNQYLQVIYYLRKSEAAYGFISAPTGDKNPRNIRTNAEQHRNRGFMLNADFLDFFHQIKQNDVFEIFLSPPFNFTDEVATMLSKLTTYKGRLPMGSPTSPVLSNFATLPLDYDLLALSQKNGWTFTRFADDLCFSSDQPILLPHLDQIRYVCDGYGLKFNENKIHFFDLTQTKKVTGLVVSNRVDIPTEYLENLKKEIDKYRTVLEINYRTGRQASKWVERFRQQIEGAIEFVRQVETSKSPDYQMIRQYFRDAQQVAETYEPVSWLEFGYHHFI